MNSPTNTSDYEALEEVRRQMGRARGHDGRHGPEGYQVTRDRFRGAPDGTEQACLRMFLALRDRL